MRWGLTCTGMQPVAGSFPRIPPRLNRWEELNRRVASLSEHVLERIEAIERALPLFSFAAYASASTTPGTPLPDLGLGWETIPLDTAGAVRAITINLGNDSFAFQYDGVYQITLSGSLNHNNLNAGRTVNIRLFNVTLGTPLPGAFPIGISRNVEDTVITISLLAEITDAEKGQEMRIEIGGGDAVSLVSISTMNVAIANVSEWREPFT